MERSPAIMAPVPIERLADHAGETVEIDGWLYNLRSSGAIHFLLVRDGTGLVQAVASRSDVPADLFTRIGELTQESSITVRGVVREDRRAPGGYELSLRDLHVVQQAAPYPITPKEHGVEFLMDHRHLWLRSSRQWAILRIRAEVERAMCEYLDAQG
jgi:asparaginyl-tRNA synthetase